MAFGRKRQRSQTQSEEPSQIQIRRSPTQNVDAIEEENQPQQDAAPASQASEESSGSSQNKTKPLLDEVVHIVGTRKWSCKHCKSTYSSSYTRIHQHFLGPGVGKKADVARCPEVLKNRDLLQRIRIRVEEAERIGISPSLSRSTISNSHSKPSSSTNFISKSFATMERNQVDNLIVKALCANGIPFNVLRNPDFQAMLRGVNRAPNDYKPVTYDRARTIALDECQRDVEKDLTPIKDTWITQGCSIVSDGWTNIKREPLINVVASNNRGSMFMYAKDFSGLEKTGVNIAAYLLEAIDEVGPSNVLQVVTDNAANCKAAGKEIEKVHKHIFWSPCVVHTLNLIFKDFACAFPWMIEIYARGKKIVKYFLNHEKAHAIFKTQSKLELLKVAKTRFASHHLLLKRLSRCREALACTVVLRSWEEWVSVGDEQTKSLGKEVAATVLDKNFWEELEIILVITKPIFLMIKFADGEGEKMGEIYEKMDCMIGEIRDIMKKNKYSYEQPKMEEILLSRWEKMNIPMHCLGFALNPFYYDANYLNAPAPGGEPRRAPNQDREVVAGVLKFFDKVGEDENEKAELRKQLARFQNKLGIFGTAAAKMDASTMSPISWWSTYGSETPELAEIAIKGLSQPISSSSAERVWSTYSYIHNVKRNRLNAKRADKLVFIHSNLRLLSRFTSAYKEGPCKKWDIDPESAYFDDSTVRLEDLRWEE